VRILRISLRNFRGTVSSEVRFAPTGLTVIEGPNEVGKSSLAEALDLVLTYPDSSHHRDVEEVQPVNRSDGPEVEVEFTTGDYRLVYFKRWLHRPETLLTILAPSPANLVARQAHDKVEAILEETLDDTLYRALRFVQGEKIQQGAVDGSSTLIGALDRAASGGTADPKAESTLWDAMKQERARHCYQNGKPVQERGQLQLQVSDLEAKIQVAQGALAELEATGEEYRYSLRRQRELQDALSVANEELMAATSTREALQGLELEIEKGKAAASEALAKASAARGALDARMARVAELANQQEEAGHLAEADEAEAPALERLEEESRSASEQLKTADLQRQATAAGRAVAERDFTFRRAELDHSALRRRLERVEEARHTETAAHMFLDGCKVTKEARAQVAKAVAQVTKARAARDVASPSYEVEALADVDLSIDDQQLRLDKGTRHEGVVSDKVVVTVGGVMTLRFRTGTTVQAAQEATRSAEQHLAELCERFGLHTDDPVSEVIDALGKRRDAEAQIKQAREAKEEALDGQSEEELAAKVQSTGALVASYPAAHDSESPIPAGLEAAEKALAAAKEAEQAAAGSEKAARTRADGLQTARNEKQVEVRTNAGMLEEQRKRFARAEAELGADRATNSDVELEAVAAAALATAQSAQKGVEDLEAAYRERDPDTTKLQFDNFDRLVQRLTEEQKTESLRLVELGTTLQVKGASNVQADLDAASAKLAQLAPQRDERERQARAAELLFATFSRHRDQARLGYVAPYQTEIEKLARLVFGADTSVQIDPDDFSIRSRTVDRVTVPFESLSTGAREQLAVLSRLACAILVNPDGANGDVGVPVILDDALGNSDPSRLRRLAPAFTSAARQAQVIVMTSTPERYGGVGEATIVRLQRG
jgi:hypothetical protein